MNLFFAPLQGYTDAAYRIFHSEIYPGCIDCYYTPFMRVEQGIPRKKDLKDLEHKSSSIKIVPQIIVKNVEEFDILVESISKLGYSEIDINMGCPFPLQVKKGRGAGLLSNPFIATQILQEVSKRSNDMTFSLKMRLGNEDNTQWRNLVDIINRTPLKCITLHPRNATQQYKGEVSMEEFSNFYNKIQHKIIYNGDLTTLSQIKNIVKEYPKLYGVMLGRGMLGRPSLAYEYKNGIEMSQSQIVKNLICLHNKLFQFYLSKLQGESHLLTKMKTYWDFSEQTIGHKLYKQIKKSSTLSKYNSIIRTIEDLI